MINLEIQNDFILQQRVRGAPKRRPSTRRARQEAIRKSGIEFNIDVPIPDTVQTDNFVSPTESEKIIQNVANNNVEENTSDKNVSKNVNKPESSIFSDDEGDIFKVKKTQIVVKKSLFDDEEDDDDIFNSLPTKPAVTTGMINF